MRMGSARVPRVGERVLAIANFSCVALYDLDLVLSKDCFGATPKPARETHALPKHTVTQRYGFTARLTNSLPLSVKRHG
jgi:hypothetical protein